jgi:hypothetical protein
MSFVKSKKLERGEVNKFLDEKNIKMTKQTYIPVEKSDWSGRVRGDKHKFYPVFKNIFHWKISCHTIIGFFPQSKK